MIRFIRNWLGISAQNKRAHKAVKENVPGDFYVKDNCCTFCGVPDSLAPNLFGGFDENGKVIAEQCYVKKQPENEKELEQMIKVMAAQDLACIRYCGKSTAVIEKITAVGEGGQID